VNALSGDEADWALAARGEGEAFGRVFDRHRNRVRRHSLRLVPALDDAEDVVAATFLEAWRRRDNVRFVNGSMLPWLLVTATNVARNMSRSHRRHRTLLDRLPAPIPHPDHADSFDEGPASAALLQLSTADQQVITLCVLHDLSEADAASALGVAPGTVKSRLSRAKSRLGRLLNENSNATAHTLGREASHDF
jgi:RNA polymerase sigma-70 factor (ECF subfamily)